MQITVENINQNLPLIQESLNHCDFVAFDSEFTGNTISYSDKPHDFDTFNDKYRKSKRAVEQFIAFEIGLTFFTWSQQSKKYEARPFNFLIYPRSTIDP